MATARYPLVNFNRDTVRKVSTRGVEFDILNLLCRDTVRFQEDFLRTDSLADFTVDGKGTETATALVSAGVGHVDLITGTSDNDTSFIYLPNLTLVPNKNPVFIVRLNLASIAAVKCEVGLSDTVTAAVLGATGTGVVDSLAATPTLTTGASDVVAAIMDTDSALDDPTYWRLVTAKAGTTALATYDANKPAAVRAPVAATYQWIALGLRASLESTPKIIVDLYVNGVHLVSSINDAITQSATLNPYVMVQTRTTAAKTLSLDYFEARFDRDTTA